MPIKTFIKESGRMIKLMDSDSTFTLMELSMMASGLKISSRAKARRSGPMVPNSKDTTKMERNMD